MREVAMNDDQEEFGEFCVRWLPGLQHKARSFLKNEDDAKEAVQEALLHVWRSRRTVRDQKKLPGIVFEAVKNACMDKRRRDQARPVSGFELTAVGEKTILSEDPLPDAIVQEAEQMDVWSCVCKRILSQAGFIQPVKVRPLFHIAMKGGELSIVKILERADRRDLDAQACLRFLSREASYALALVPTRIARLYQYRVEAEKVIHEIAPNVTKRVMPLLIDTHMVTMPWPGWPFSICDDIAYPPKTPAYLVKLAGKLDAHCLREHPAEFGVFLRRVHERMQRLQWQWQWPFPEEKQLPDGP